MNKIKMDLTKELPYAVEESINRLRINVSFLGNEIKKIMVVSTMPNEGKSFVTLQMWRQMASAGIKSVFVDGDMRNSVIVNKYGIEKEDGSEMKGLAHYLAEEFPLENVSDTLKGDTDLGFMLYHMKFEDGGHPKDNDWDKRNFSDKADALFYRPHMIDGVIDVAKYREMMKC